MSKNILKQTPHNYNKTKNILKQTKRTCDSVWLTIISFGSESNVRNLPYRLRRILRTIIKD